MIRSLVLSLAGLLVLPLLALAEEARSKHPVQLQLLAPSTYWGGTTQYDAGYALGLHLGSTFYLGVMGRQEGRGTKVMAMGSMRGESMAYQQEDVESSDFRYQASQAMELRISPFDPGLYLSLGQLKLGAQEENYLYKKKARALGDGAYVTDLSIKIEREAYSGPAVGLGFVHIFDNGFSLGLGALGATGSRDRTITVTAPHSDSPVSAADLEAVKKDVSFMESVRPAWFAYLGIGWNF